MISLEYIIAQFQYDLVSVAINSKKTKNQNPAVEITKLNNKIIWFFHGLHIGITETISGKPRANRIDFYMGMDDLIEQRSIFPLGTGKVLGSPDGLRNPVGTERAGGKLIRWQGALGRIPIEDANAKIQPLIVQGFGNIILNIDRESSPYSIVSNKGHETEKELHFGVQGNYQMVKINKSNPPEIFLQMSEDQYTTVLYYIDESISLYKAI